MGRMGTCGSTFHPNNVVNPFSVTGGYARDPWGFSTDAANTVTRHRDEVMKGAAGWFLPTIEAMRAQRLAASCIFFSRNSSMVSSSAF